MTGETFLQTLQVVWTSHRYAGIDQRERIAAGDAAVEALLAEAGAALRAGECVLLRTCNRIELYYLGPVDPDLELTARRLICQADGPGTLSLDAVCYARGTAALAHLFEVASGLDSLVLGEHEILGQVKRATTQEPQGAHAGPTLRRLFHHAVRVGKRARRETAISSGIFSVGQCGVRRAQEVLGSLAGKSVLIFGAGRIAKAAAQHLAEAGAGPITVFSRTYERAQQLADSVGGEAITGEALPGALRRSDVLVGCTSAPHHVVTVRHIQEALSGREAHPFVVIDLGEPRNVEPAVGAMPGVHLFNLDDLEQVVAAHAGEREREVARVRAIVDAEVTEFTHWFARTQASELIRELRAKAEEARQECLRLAERRCCEQDAEQVGYLTDLLVRKLLHGPITAILSAAAEQADGDAAVLTAARALFGLESDVSEGLPVAHVGSR